jgi:ribosomal protein S18 acetylase RimI-like enzyme
VYVGWERRRPVASSFLVLGAGVAGVYGVHTDPAERGRGLGAALTRAPMREARDAGYEVAVLQAAPKAAALYERIGFRSVCEVGIYEREPERSASDEPG